MQLLFQFVLLALVMLILKGFNSYEGFRYSFLQMVNADYEIDVITLHYFYACCIALRTSNNLT